MDQIAAEQKEPVYFNGYVIAWQIFLLMFFVDSFFAGSIIFYLQLNPPESFHYSFIFALWALHTLKFLLVAYLVIRAILFWAERRIYITDHQIYAVRGILRKREQIYELHQLRSISMRQSWLGRRFNYGSVTCVFSASGYTDKLNLPNVINPHYYAELIGKHLT